MRGVAVLAVLTLGVGLMSHLTGRGDGSPVQAAPNARCHGVDFGQVRGTAPANARPPLRRYRVATAVCAAYWIPQVDARFVPQALAVRGSSAYVSGYQWHPRYADRNCQLAVVDLRTGRVTAFVRRFQAPVYGPRPTYCRHGGGVEVDAAGLWVAETERLWLLDPGRLGRSDPVLRVWRMPPGVRGSTLVIAGDRLGVAGWARGARGRIWWFDRSAILARPARAEVPAPESTARVPARVQGVTWSRGGLWVNSSSTHCALLRPAGRPPVELVPGSEDVQVAGRDLWTVSEAGTRPYLDGSERTVPMLLRLDLAAVLGSGRPECRF